MALPLRNLVGVDLSRVNIWFRTRVQ